MNIDEAAAILYGPVPKHRVVIDSQSGTETLHLTDRELTRVLESRNMPPCAIFVAGVLVRRVKR